VLPRVNDLAHVFDIINHVEAAMKLVLRTLFTMLLIALPKLVNIEIEPTEVKVLPASRCQSVETGVSTSPKIGQ